MRRKGGDDSRGRVWYCIICMYTYLNCGGLALGRSGSAVIRLDCRDIIKHQKRLYTIERNNTSVDPT